jgi:hypothetical protein
MRFDHTAFLLGQIAFGGSASYGYAAFGRFGLQAQFGFDLACDTQKRGVCGLHPLYEGLTPFNRGLQRMLRTLTPDSTTRAVVDVDSAATLGADDRRHRGVCE